MMTAERALIAIAVVALLAVSTQAPGSEPYFSHTYDVELWVKNMEVVWPATSRLCTIPVSMKIGYFIEIDWPDDDYLEANTVEARDVGSRKIVLRQVDCKDIRRDNEKDWPCYTGCVKLSIRATFDVKLGTRLDKTSAVIDQWEAYLGNDIVIGSGQWQTVKACVHTWGARLHDAMGGQQLDVGTLTITVKPAV